VDNRFNIRLPSPGGSLGPFALGGSALFGVPDGGAIAMAGAALLLSGFQKTQTTLNPISGRQALNRLTM